MSLLRDTVALMANAEHVAALTQGGDAWNEWRNHHRVSRPDLTNVKLMGRLGDEPNGGELRNADLSNADLSGATLYNLNITGANLTGVVACWADLRTSDFRGSKLDGSDLRCAAFNGGLLERASLRSANLNNAKLYQVDCTEADFTGADLRHAYISRTLFNATILTGADMTAALIGRTVFANVDLRLVKGLEQVEHREPSTIGIDTIYHSNGRIPDAFMRGSGLPETFITYAHSLIGQSIQFYSCFISYSTTDQEFADRLHADLQSKGVRCWFAPHHIAAGKKVHEQIDEAIRLHERLLLILSPASMASDG